MFVTLVITGYNSNRWVMTRILLITALTFSVICMVPLMGAGHTTHLHHGAAVYCATCMGSEPHAEVVFFSSLVGFVMLRVPSAPILIRTRDLFHPPRAR
jgi:hypothetical protein